MIAIQYINMRWTKENRNPQSAVERKQYFIPVETTASANIDGSEVFMQTVKYEQTPEGIYKTEDTCKYLTKLKDINVPGIKVIKREDSHEVVWYSLAMNYKPERKGVHRYRIENSQYDDPELRCDTAFYLKEGESGVLKYNYRYVSSYGQHYEQFLVYVINTDKLEPDSFINAVYDKSYIEMADLF